MDGLDEAQIRQDERLKIADLIGENVDALTKFTPDPRGAFMLLAYLLRLQGK